MNDEELRTRWFNNVFDEYLKTAKMASEDYERLSALQRTVIQCVKRSFERYDRKADKGAE